MAEDTWALNEGAIDEDDFLSETRLIQSEREAMFFSALDRQQSGVVACVFDTSDRIQHRFYRYLDPAHQVGKHSGVIERMYRDMDRLVGRPKDRLPEYRLFEKALDSFYAHRLNEAIAGFAGC